MITSLLRAASVSLRLPVFCGLAATFAVAQPSVPAEAPTRQLEPFQVTGTRIRRVDYETPAPVSTFTAADLASSGFSTLGEYLQTLPLNAGQMNAAYFAGSFTKGASTANFRGLGSHRFLTLVNGRRVVTYPLTQSDNRSVFDLNNLPVSAIERVELLKDGASAIYGADAITGVLNVRLKSNFSGLNVGAYYGNTLGSEGGRDSGVFAVDAMAGVSDGKTRFVTSLEARTQNSNFIRDYGTRTTDYTGPRGTNQNSTSNWPANLTLTRSQAGALGLPFPTLRTGQDPDPARDSFTYVLSGGQPSAAPTLAQFRPAPESPPSSRGTVSAVVGNNNRYNFADTYELYPASDRLSSFTSFEHGWGDGLTVFGQLLFTRNNTYYAYTPAVVTYLFEGLTLPANNPYNPFGIPLNTLSGRTNFGPVRKLDVASSLTHAVGGARGTLTGDWTWESAVSYGVDHLTLVQGNVIAASTYRDALNGTLPGYTGKFLNPFGPSDPGLTSALFTSITGTNRSELASWDATVTGKVFRLPAGAVGVAAGVEVRSEELSSAPDMTPIIAPGGGSAFAGRRTVASQYVEVTAPLFARATLGSAELQLAGRHEHYSDFGDATKPKVGVKWRLPRTRVADVLLRASYSESFQAPALGMLYTTRSLGSSTSQLRDPLRPQDPPTSLRVVTGGNPNLEPETARAKYVGGVVEIPSVKGLSFSVDYFDLRVNSVIVTPSANFLTTLAGIAQFPQAIVRDASLGNPGPIVRLESVPQNNPAAYQLYRGIDYEVRYDRRNTAIGSYGVWATATQTVKAGADAGLGGGFAEATGYYATPDWRGAAGANWRRGNLGASVVATWMGHFYNNQFGWAENPYTLVSPSLTYSGWWRSTVTIGATNVFDHRPPLNGFQTVGFDPNLYGAGALGRFVYVRVGKTF